jgi:hypothetical protein
MDIPGPSDKIHVDRRREIRIDTDQQVKVTVLSDPKLQEIMGRVMDVS